MNSSVFQVIPHNSHYEGAYDEREVLWRSVCAIDKARNCVQLLGDRKSEVSSVLEVGCGTGAVLRGVKNRGVGSVHKGIDMADPNVHPDPEVVADGLEMLEYDGSRLPFDGNSFDLVFSSHVLEHVPDERSFIGELKRVARKYIYIEVPCELHLRTSVRAMQRTLDIGHINAYTPESLVLTLETSGLSVLDFKVFDHSREVHAFSTSPMAAAAKTILRGGLLKINQSLASKIFTYHCGALCVAA